HAQPPVHRLAGRRRETRLEPDAAGHARAVRPRRAQSGRLAGRPDPGRDRWANGIDRDGAVRQHEDLRDVRRSHRHVAGAREATVGTGRRPWPACERGCDEGEREQERREAAAGPSGVGAHRWDVPARRGGRQRGPIVVAMARRMAVARATAHGTPQWVAVPREVVLMLPPAPAPPATAGAPLLAAVANALGCAPEALAEVRLRRLSFDARPRARCWRLVVDAWTPDEPPPPPGAR